MTYFLDSSFLIDAKNLHFPIDGNQNFGIGFYNWEEMALCEYPKRCIKK